MAIRPVTKAEPPQGTHRAAGRHAPCAQGTRASFRDLPTQTNGGAFLAHIRRIHQASCTIV